MMPCLACGGDVVAPLDLCTTCGGPALYALPDGGEHAVELGPVPSQQSRDEAIRFLTENLAHFDPAAAAKKLAGSRVRVAEGLSERTARALVERLDRKATQAEAVTGTRARLGAAGAMKGGLPLAGLAGGAIAWVVADAVLFMGVGTAVAVGLAAANMQRRIPSLGTAHVRKVLPYGVSDVPDRLARALDKLPPSQPRTDLLAAAGVALRLVAELMDDDSLASIAGGGTTGPLCVAATKLAQEATRVAEAAAAAPGGVAAAALSEVGELAHEAMRGLAKLQTQSGVTQENITQEIELVLRMAEDLGKL